MRWSWRRVDNSFRFSRTVFPSKEEETGVEMKLLPSAGGLLDSLEGPNLAPMERVARDVHEVMLNMTTRSPGALLKAH
ncbi:hypothetical protein XENOCAPTIV_022860 [Xenoophorus captivus]|uniref:Uncharacterized protein n=1 Tax=Xenoophorus captivus TaxID=1517983 RepID=A0ABV0RJ57_9TELE